MQYAETNAAWPAARLSRRGFLIGSGVALGAAVVGLSEAAPAQAAATTARFDPLQRYVRIVGGGNGILYLIQADGTLYWMRHLGWQTGAAEWANRAVPRAIGAGWHTFEWVGASFDGTLYALTGDGNVYAYKYLLKDPATGAGSWQPRRQVASGWTFPRVFGGPDDVLWAVDEDGDLYRAELEGDQFRPVRVDSGWQASWYAMADTGGVLYSVNEGVLSWFRYADGQWQQPAGGIPIDNGWLYPSQIQIACGGAGAMYLLHPDPDHVPERDGVLTWTQLANPQTVDADGSAQWRPQKHVGSGFTLQRTAALQGYPLTPSVAAGQTVRFALSGTVGKVQATVVRCDASADLPAVSGTTTVTPTLQRLSSDFRSNGCRWRETPGTAWVANAPSGVYALQLTGPNGMRRDIPFVVRPAKPSAPIAVLLPTNTYDAYNAWGGHSAYTYSNIRHARVLTRLRPAQNLAVRPEGRVRSELYSDLLLLRWMHAHGLAYDVYTDPDLDANPRLLDSYRALVLGSHAEYWTSTMRQALADYQETGGRVISTGGNSVFERVSYPTKDRTAVRFRKPNGWRDLFLYLNQPSTQLLGVEFDHSGTFAPYQVVNDHPLLAGSGLRPGDTFGATGYNGGASGWEVDGLTGRPGEALETQILAQGTNPGGGAVMALIPRPLGGFVFTSSSISFNGALGDPAISTIMSNVFTAALADRPAITTGHGLPRRAGQLLPSRPVAPRTVEGP